MMYRFKSRDDADVVMTQPVAERMLLAIGKEVSKEGILLPDQMPDALTALQQAVGADDTSRAGQHDHDRDDDARHDDDHAPSGDAVSLRRRVWPLVEMIKRAQAAGVPVTWHA